MKNADFYKGINQQLVLSYPLFEQVSRIQSNGGILERYGSLFPSLTDEINQLANALAIVNSMSKELGSLDSIKLQLATHPDSVSSPYSNSDTVWEGLLKQAKATKNACNNLINTVQTLPSLIDSQKTEKEIAWDVKCALCGPGGASSQGNTPKNIAIEISARITHLIEQLEPVLLDISTSNLYSQATQTRMALQGKIDTLKANVIDAKEKYEGAFFGKEKKKANYEEMNQLLEATEKSLEESERYCSEFKHIDVNASAVIPALAEVNATLTQLTKLLAGIEPSMNFCNLASPEQMADKDWVFKALGMPEFEETWKDLEKQTASLI